MTEIDDVAGTVSDGSSGTDDWYISRAAELESEGMSPSVAFDRALTEQNLTQWPEKWGDDLEVLIYGDFLPPSEEVHFEHLGITVFPEKQEGTVISSALVVLRARVSVREKSIDALADATDRLDLLLGSWFVAEWGNSYAGWWSFLTHSSSGGVLPRFPGDSDLEEIAAQFDAHGEELQRKLRAALYWLREPRSTLKESHRSDVLRRYHGLANAFEVLVDAICLLQPAPKLAADEQQRRIDETMRQHDRLTPNDVRALYHEVTNPGFRVKAEHALRVRFGTDADSLIELFFEVPRRDRLYQIRNDIAHGNVSPGDPSEIARIGEKAGDLLITVLAMLGAFLPFAYPVHTKRQSS